MSDDLAWDATPEEEVAAMRAMRRGAFSSAGKVWTLVAACVAVLVLIGVALAAFAFFTASEAPETDPPVEQGR